MESNWRWGVAAYDMQLSGWELCARLPDTDALFVKDADSPLYYLDLHYLEPAFLPLMRWVGNSIPKEGNFPMGLNVDPDNGPFTFIPGWSY